MRISVSMLRRLSAGILALVVLLLVAAPAVADTGTYQINDYIVTLEPQNDGRVLITIEQGWEVLSGSIPWITVGLPNGNFEIKSFSGDASTISDDSGGGFYGVRLNLDKDYQPGSTFNIKFTVLQSKLLERLTDENLWRIGFAPGWYDNAVIGHLQVNLVSPVVYDTYATASPPPTVSGNVLSWELTNVSPGGRLNITVESVDGAFLTAVEPVSTDGGGLGTGFWVFVIIVVAIGLLVIWAIRQSKKKQDEYIRGKATAIEDMMAKDPEKKKEVNEKFQEYVDNKNLRADEQGRYYDRSYGNYITPAIWWAILANQQRNNAGIPPVNRNTRPGCVHSCACVSCACACACACAGGGAAGCSRKTLHEFRMKQRGRQEESNKIL